MKKIILCLLLFGLTTTVWGGWGPWSDLGSFVSVSYSQVNGNTWTWKFRNDGSSTITYMEFKYTDSLGVHQGGLNVLPFDLKPGQAFGGWTAFASTGSSRPSVAITKIQRK